MIKKKINQAMVLMKDALAYTAHFLHRTPVADKSIVVNFINPQLYHRFFYLLLKFYQIEGYQIYYPMNFSLFRNIRNKDRYLSLLLQEKNFLTINTKNFPENALEINDAMFSEDYFLNYFKKNNEEQNCYHVPMSFHPYMYHFNLWNRDIQTDRERFNAVFCYGNFDDKAYLAIKKTGFKVITRTRLLEFFREKPQFTSVKKKEQITQGELSEFNQKYVFAIKTEYAIEMKDIRELLSYFTFYLCCPGVVMPLCHNVIEAMSVGTIPLIQRTYAAVMYPPLEHKVNAIIFEDLADLNTILHQEIFTISEEKIQEMRENVLSYYVHFLTPSSVVAHLNNALLADKKIYLQAEHRSVKFN